MVNPNNNKHFNDEALRINRILKKENDYLKATIKQMKEALKALGVNYKEEDDGIKTVSKRHS
jgi:signal recognition particle subunit SEC65